MSKNKIFATLLAAAFTITGALAQNSNQNLNKEITLEKDVAPLEHKATKKNELPKVKKTVNTTPTHTQLGYSDAVSPINVPTTVPTLLPYGYRTAHIFSDKRGYLDIGGGTQANFAGSFGYRILDEEHEQLGVWLQHNSTWEGTNPSKAVPDGIDRNKHKFNDNALGVNYTNAFKVGTLSLGATGHVDNFNYYGGWNEAPVSLYDDEWTSTYDWNTDKQTFYDLSVYAGWASDVNLLGKPLHYSALAAYGHGAYDKSYYRIYKSGTHDDWVNLTLNGSYELNNGGVVGLGVKGEYLTRGIKALSGYPNPKDEVGLITLSPYYRFATDRLTLQLGVNGHIAFSDGGVFKLSPNVKLDYALTPGVKLFATATGGKSLGYLYSNHATNRYDDPLSIYGTVYTPLDAEAGVQVGPFQGLSAHLGLGYGIVKDQPVVCYQSPSQVDPVTYMAVTYGMATHYLITNTRGYYLNAGVNYKYRSLAEVAATLKYAPQDKDNYYSNDKYLNGYGLGLDRPTTVATVDVKVMPLRPLAVDLGLEYRGGRRLLSATDGLASFAYTDMDDLIDLHAGASYRLNSSLTLWAKAHNLLNRRQDFLYGMGQQRLGVMGGIAIVF